jgi:hypothetical protein
LNTDLTHFYHSAEMRRHTEDCRIRRSSGAHLPAVPGGLVPPEREVQSEQRKCEKIKENGAARGVAAAA